MTWSKNNFKTIIRVINTLTIPLCEIYLIFNYKWWATINWSIYVLPAKHEIPAFYIMHRDCIECLPLLGKVWNKIWCWLLFIGHQNLIIRMFDLNEFAYEMPSQRIKQHFKRTLKFGVQGFQIFQNVFPSNMSLQSGKLLLGAKFLLWL